MQPQSKSGYLETVYKKKQKNTFENLHKLAKTADMESFLSKLAGLSSTVL